MAKTRRPTRIAHASSPRGAVEGKVKKLLNRNDDLVRSFPLAEDDDASSDHGRDRMLDQERNSPAWTMLHRIHEFREDLYCEAPGRADLLQVEKSIEDFLEVFLTARYVFCAMRESLRRSFSGKDGIVERLGGKGVVSR